MEAAGENGSGMAVDSDAAAQILKETENSDRPATAMVTPAPVAGPVGPPGSSDAEPPTVEERVYPGATRLLQKYLRQVLPVVLDEISDWTSKARSFATNALAKLLYIAGDTITQVMHPHKM